MERKENDLMLNIVANPNFSITDFATIGFNIDNTSLQDIQVYKNNPLIQKQFTDNEEKFNEKSFMDAYNNASIAYNIMANENFDKLVKSQVSYHRDDIFAPADQRREGPDFKQVIVPNPDRVTSSIYRLGQIGNRTKSRDELAQSNKVLLNPTEVEKGADPKWGETPNNGFFDYFFDTLVMAQWDEDGTHVDPITGEEAEHKKGELKINEDGTYYYEKLDGRDVYGRQVLNKMNVLTEDGSKWNRYDFFDSDDIEQKSFGGTVLKNLALVGTMFIPYVGPVVTAASLVPQLVGLTGTLGKMLSGSENPLFSEMEGWGKSLNRQTAKTEYAQENTWCWENFIGLIGDVAGQLREQRFFFEKIPAIFKGSYAGSQKAYNAKLAQFEKKYEQLTESKISNLRKELDIYNQNELAKFTRASRELYSTSALKAQAEMDSWMKGYNKIGEILSKGYMTAITIQDTYGEAKEAGATDLEATLLTLGYAAAEYKIIDSALGEWILPELRADRFKNQAIIRAISSLPKETENLYKQFGAQLKNFSKEGKKEYTRKLFNIGKNIAKYEYANGSKTLKATLAAGAGEGVEEISEEFLADFSKGCFNTLKWLQGSDTRMSSFGFTWDENGNRTWDSKEMLDRYSMSLIGGAVGGSLTNIGTNYRMGKSLSNMNSTQAIQEIVYMARNNELDGLLKTLEKMDLGDKNLSSEIQEVNGQLSFKPGTIDNNQDLQAKRAVLSQINMIQNILNAEGANLSDDSFLDRQTLGDLRYNALHKAATAGLFMQEYNTLITDLVKTTDEINKIINSSADTNKDGVVTDLESRRAKLSDEQKKILSDKEKELNEIRTKLKDLTEGKRADEFIGITLFEMQSALSGNMLPVTFPLYAEKIYNKKYSELTDKEKEFARQSYIEWKNSDAKDQIRMAAQVYKDFATQSSSVIKNHEQTYLNQNSEVKKIDSAIRNLYQTLQLIDSKNDSDNWLNKAQTLSDVVTTITNLAKIIQKDDITAIFDDINQRTKDLKNISDEKLRQQEFKKIKLDLNNRISDMLSQSIDKYIDPFVQQGFANTETKNQLKRITNTIRGILGKRSAKYEFKLDMGEEIDPNPYLPQLNRLDELDSKIDSLNNTPFEQNLNQFAISIGQDPINITKLLKDLNNIFNKSSVQDFTIEGTTLEELSNAIATIEIYKQAILGARTDDANLDDLFGYNATLNEVSKKLGKDLDLAEINSSVADIFLADIDTNLNKLKFFEKLYTVNQGQKLGRQNKISVKKDLLFYNGLKKIISVGDNDPIRQLEGFAEFEVELNSLSFLDEILGRKSYSLSNDEKIQFEQQKIKMEDAIYNFVQKNLDIVKLQQIISVFDVYTQSSELLNESLQEMDGPSMIWYIAARTAVKSSDFYTAYKEILDPDSKITSIPTQELAVYNNYANIVNGNVISLFQKAYREYIKEDWKNKTPEQKIAILEKNNSDTSLLYKKEFDDYCFNFLPVPRYSNVALVEGIPGSGKTEAVIRMTVQMLKKYHPDLLKDVTVVHGANGDSAVTLKENCEISNGKTYNAEEFLNKIIKNHIPFKYDDDGTCKISKDNYKFNSDNEVVGQFELSSIEIPSLIVIDEITKFNTYELDAINEYAQKFGITVIAAGDFDQIGVSGQHSIKFNNQTFDYYSVSLERNQFSRVPKLGVSMRTDNMIKTKNLSYFQTYMNSEDLSQGLKLFYYEDETGLYGDKVFTSSNQEDIKNQIREMIKTLKPIKKGDKEITPKIGYIYNDKNSSIYKFLNEAGIKEHIDFKEGGTAQGLEGQYYIIDQSISKIDYSDKHLMQKGKKKWNREVYTGMSRASQGSLIIVPDSGSNLYSEKTSKLIKENLGQDTKKKHTQERKNILDQIINGKVPQYIPRNKINNITDQSENDITKQSDEGEDGLDEGVDTSDDSEQNDLESNKKPIEFTPSRQDMIDKFGPKMGITELEIEIDGKRAILPLVDIPYDVHFESGNIAHTNNNIVDIDDRKIVLVKIGNHVQPFYCSTGKAGKTYVDANGITRDVPHTWYPFFGLETRTDTDGEEVPFRTWINKGHSWKPTNPGHSIIGYYDNPVFKAICEKLNEKFGTDLTNEQLGYNILQSAYDHFKWVQVINQSMHPTNSDDSKVFDNIDEAKRITSEQWDIVSKSVNESQTDNTTSNDTDTNSNDNTLDNINEHNDDSITNDHHIPAPINLADSDSEVIVNTVKDEEKYKQAIDKYNSNDSPEIKVTQNNKGIIDLEIFLYSFNTFELGVVVDADGNIIDDGKWSQTRIDSINGLRKIDQLVGITNQTLENYKVRLGILRSILFNSESKEEMCKKLVQALHLKDLSVDFAFKTSPVLTTIKEKNQDYLAGSPDMYGKNKNERIISNSSSDERSQEVNPHSLVALISTPQTGDILEIPLLTLTSPFTLAQQTINGENGIPIPVFPELYDILVTKYWDTFVDGKPSKNTPKLSELAELLKNKCDEYPKYKNIGNLIELYLFSYNGLFRIKDPTWIPSTHLNNLGSQFTVEKGDLHLIRGFDFESYNESNWINLSEYAKDPQLRISSIMKSKSGKITIGSEQVKKVKAGHPFVLISYDTSIYTDDAIVKQYIAQQQPGYKGIPKVRLQYVLSPTIELNQYINYLKDILINKQKNLVPLGNSHMPYNILKILKNNKDFLKIIEKRVPSYQQLLDLISQVEKIDQKDTKAIDTILKSDVLVDVRRNGQIYKQKVKLGTHFAMQLLLLTHDSTNPTNNFDFNSTKILNQNIVNNISRILEFNKKKLFYDVKLSQTQVGPFIVAKVDNPKENELHSYTIDRKPFMINGKIDSYMFQADMSALIQEWVNQLHWGKTKNNKNVRKSYDDYKKPNQKKPKNTTEYVQLQNVLTKLNNIQGVEELINNLDLDPTTFNKQELDNTLNKLVETINSSRSNTFAIKLGNNILTTSDELFKDSIITISDSEGKQITELKLDNLGTQTFNINVWKSNGEMISYNNAVYDDGIITIDIPLEITQEVQLSVNESNFNEYLTRLRSLINKIKTNLESEGKTLKQIPVLMRLFTDNIIDIDQLKSKMRYSQRATILYSQLLDQEQDLSNKELLQELINYNESLNPDKQTNENESCPIPLQIKLI